MNARNPILSPLAPGIGRRLRTASICLLAIAASISVHAFAPTHTTPARPAPARAALQSESWGRRTVTRLTTPHHHRPRRFTHARLHGPIPSVSNAAIPPFTWRTHLEGTDAPSSEGLTALLLPPMSPYALPRPESPAFRNTSASTSNRQRAP
jgi:hypothetical protein